jgi:ferredoxin/nitrate reductase gamma subunit
MHFTQLVEGPLLSVALSIFFAGIIIRTALFVLSTLQNQRTRNINKRNITAIFGRVFLPHHRLVDRKPFYTFSRYLFHFCVFIVPIWLYGHIIFWEDSVFEISWQSLPDIWADRLTLIVLGLSAWFFMRRIFFKRVRAKSSLSDHLLIIMVALPFLTGYFLVHGTLESIPLLDNYMMTIHVLSGELILIAAAFLFCKIRLDRDSCIGCAACELICPTGTLETNDEEGIRFFAYSHYQCVCCGACVRACPEGAAELRHEIGGRNIFQLFSKDTIRSVELSVCKRCGSPYLPSPQLDKVGALLADDSIHSCPACKTAAAAEKLYMQDPRRGNSRPMFSEQHWVNGAE